MESIPLASKLPMVCVPVGWGRQEEAVGQKQLIPALGELVGGYLVPCLESEKEGWELEAITDNSMSNP